MDKNKINEEINKLMKNKKFVNSLIVLLAIMFLWLAVSTFIEDTSKFTKSNSNDAPIGAEEVLSTENVTTSKELLDYETEQKEILESILSKIDGVGQVVATIYFESSEIKVPAMNSSTQTSETQEEDTNGGTRLTKQETEGATVVMQGGSSSNEPFITKTYKPQITGVLIVAEGAKSSKITYDIQKAVSSLYNLSLEKVNVYPMES